MSNRAPIIKSGFVPYYKKTQKTLFLLLYKRFENGSLSWPFFENRIRTPVIRTFIEKKENEQLKKPIGAFEWNYFRKLTKKSIHKKQKKMPFIR